MEFLRALFDLIFPLLILFVIWRLISRPGRKAGKVASGPPGKAGKKPEEVEFTVNPLDVLKEMFFGGLEMPGPPRPVAGVELPMAEVDLVEEDKPITAKAAPYVRGREHPAASPVAVPLPVPGVPSEPGGSALAGPGPTRQELRKAVVWSEILAPPVGFRV
jgi:hypothetical protein